jgi:arylesterase/paraoxonase
MNWVASGLHYNSIHLSKATLPMKKAFIFLLVFALGFSFQCCVGHPVVSEVPAEKIEVKPGPEDMVIDTLQDYPRLLISCSARREDHKPYGEIIAYGLQSGVQQALVRYNEPGNLLFKPHGIYLDRDLLYVISHEKEPNYHPILIYRVHGDSLEFRDLINTSDQHSPNALVTGPSGEIFFVNDSGKRGSMAEKIFKLKRASVVRLSKNQDGQWDSEIVAEKLSYPAGINRIGNRLFAGDAIQNQIHVYEIDGEGGVKPVTEFENLKGNDNIRVYKGQLLTPGHVKPFRFIKHAKKPDKLSPVEVFLVVPETGMSTSIFYTDGSQISAGSTAVIYENYLYICQVFDPFILKVAFHR